MRKPKNTICQNCRWKYPANKRKCPKCKTPKRKTFKQLKKEADMLWSKLIKVKYNYRDALTGATYLPDPTKKTRGGCDSHHLFGRAFAVRWREDCGCVLSVYNHFHIPPNSQESIYISIKLNGKEKTEELQGLSKIPKPLKPNDLLDIIKDLEEKLSELKGGGQ